MANPAKTPLATSQMPEPLAKQKPAKKTAPTRPSGTPRLIGIGASAGGLEALEAFLSHVPANSGLAFIIIQHLDPMHKGVMPELLQRITPMPVTEAGNRMQVKANCVYVIPPNKDLSILHGCLFLLDPIAARGLRLPIDFFFRSLADDQHERAIGVILSGMGSDGTLGLRAIKENAGLSLVQDPETAKFDAMPRSAIQAGLADIVAPAQELPQHILAYLNHRHVVAADSSAVNPETILPLKTQSSLEQIIILLRERTSHDFSLYKKNTIYRRIERRMGLHKIDAIASYVRYLRENPQELDLLFKELLIGVTNFFLDSTVWEQLKTVAIPALLDNYPAGKSLRAWVPACSTGEEAYTLAMIFKEALNQRQSQAGFSLQIFATDLDEDAIEKARLGFYPANISADVTPERLSRFFIQEEGGYRVNKTLREMVIFAPQNIIMDPPFTKLDIITCRNLLIYLDQALQNKLIPLFHYALTAHGILMLGNAETIGSQTCLFNSLEKNSRLYQRLDNALPVAAVDFPIKYFPVSALAEKQHRSTEPMAGQPANLETLTDQFLLQHFAPAAVLVNTDGDIVYISGRTGKYLEPAAGKANWNIYAMAREGLRNELALALKKAQRQQDAVFVPDLTLDINGANQQINLTVQAITKPDALRDKLIVVFNDVAPPLHGKPRRRKPSDTQKLLEAQLQQALEDLQTTREEMQSSQEELKSANEELQSSNEELQSTNEELNTSKEEMQSLNEELQTVNAELQSKVEDLTWVNNDMKNLLDSMEIATVFLDNQLKIRRFTSYTTHLFKLIPGDIGRHLSDIVTDLDYPQFMSDIQKVLKTLVFIDQQIKTFDNRWFKVRIMPYRTQDNIIDGVVITFIDICEIKQLEAELRDKLQ